MIYSKKKGLNVLFLSINMDFFSPFFCIFLDQFFSEAKSVFAIIKRLLIISTHWKVSDPQCILFYPHKYFFTNQAHISCTCTSVFSIWCILALKNTGSWLIQLDLKVAGVSTGQGGLYFPTATVLVLFLFFLLIFKHNFVMVTRVKVMQ